MQATVSNPTSFFHGLWQKPISDLICNSEEDFLRYVEQYGDKILDLKLSQRGNDGIDQPLFFCLRYAYPRGLSRLIELGGNNVKNHLDDPEMPPLIAMACGYAMDIGREKLAGEQLTRRQRGHVEVLRILLENKAQVNRRDLDGTFPLEYLCAADLADPSLSHCWEMLYLLFRAGVEYKIRNGGRDPLKDLSLHLSNFELLRACPLSPNQLVELFEAYQSTLRKGSENREDVKDFVPLIEIRLKIISEQLQRLCRPYADRVHSDKSKPARVVIAKKLTKKERFAGDAEAEKEILTPEQQLVKARIDRYLKEKKDAILTKEERALLKLLEGKGDRKIGGFVGPKLLEVIKIADIAIAEFNHRNKEPVTFSDSTYGMRAFILDCAPYMTTAEVFTKTLDPIKIKDREYLSNPSSWIPERLNFHEAILAAQSERISAIELGKSHKPSIWAIRGNTGAGKSHFFSHMEGMRCQPGIHLNPDELKYHLKFDANRPAHFANAQVHDEGVALFNRYKSRQMDQSLFLEGRFSTCEELDTGVLELARARNCPVTLVDLEVPLTTSLNRVLARDPFGVDPCPPLRDIVKGYRESILYRRKLIDNIKNDPLVQSYKLYYQDQQGKQSLVAEKKGNVFEVYHPTLLEASCTLLSEEEIDRLLAQPITSDYIDQAIARGDMPSECRPMLESWEGIPLEEAVKRHITGKPVEYCLRSYQEEKRALDQFGGYQIEPFTGDWLGNPALVDFVKNEQLLHVRSVDEEGRGLHFASGTFSSKLNPKFNPERGIQMKLGYFIVPPALADTFRASLLSPHILPMLQELNAKGKLLGYRFFVHPEAYDHFKSLHDANIPFVKPEDSEFMGAPTSTYRSWVVRSMEKKDAIPFIVKFGVASACNDVRRLLSRAEIEKSIQTQNQLNQVDSDLKIFQETFGIALKGIANYPPVESVLNGKGIDSGNLIRELPQDLLDGSRKYVSFSALMSVEGLREGKLPLIYEVMEATIRKGFVKTPAEFIEKYLIEEYFKAIEKIGFKEGHAFSPHGQNLCMVLTPDLIPCGFAYRDLEGFSANKQNGFLETFSWFYRYHIFIKLLNVITKTAQEYLPPPPGAPSQVGSSELRPERNLHNYIIKQLRKDAKVYPKALEILNKLSLAPEESRELLWKLDGHYICRLSRYFDIDGSGILKKDGLIPAAEKSSAGEHELLKHNAKLWKNNRKMLEDAELQEFLKSSICQNSLQINSLSKI